MSPSPDETNNRHAKRALQLGVITWLSNAAGCLISMVPIALPLGVLLVGITLITGAMAMVYGVMGKRTAARSGGDGAREARVGFWLGASHMILAALTGGAIAWLMHNSALRDIKL